MRWLLGLLALGACGRFSFDPLVTDADSDGRGDDARGDDAARGDAPMFAANIVFVSSTMNRPGDLGGIAAVDAMCNQLAASAGLAGTYVAWVSSGSGAAAGRLGTARGWVRPDGRPFADTVADLIGSTTFYPPRIDELGIDHPAIGNVSDHVFTNTEETGILGLTSCGELTRPSANSATCGQVSSGSELWTFSPEAFCRCDSPSRTYCFGVDKQVAVTPAVGPPYAFISAPWSPGNGLASADVHCQNEAAAAGLPGTFRALLGTSTATAASRFSLAGPVWRRTDGIALASSRATFMAGALEAALELSADRTLRRTEAWSGARFEGVPADAADPSFTCLDWTATVNTERGLFGRPPFAGPAFFGHGTTTGCGAPSSLYCLEQ